MNGRNGTLSPVSIDSNSNNEWSPVTKYQGLNGPDSPATGYSPIVSPDGRPPVITPPQSVHTSGSTMDGGIPNNRNRAMSNGNPSPPSSIARSSDGTGLYASSVTESLQHQAPRKPMSEHTMREHYFTLRRYLGPYLRGEQGDAPQNRARDKLVRLTPIQFQELSTDVYDESLRREDAKRSRGQRENQRPDLPSPVPSPNPNVPEFLPPKGNFHPKRNHARQKLASLAGDRFRQLATDVFYELERRFPKFVGPDMERSTSPALSTTSNRSRGPPGRGGPMNGGYRGRGGPPPGRGGPPPGRGGPPFRNGPPPGSPGLGPPGGNEYGRPLPKTFQQNTIVPNKSTLVEDDDDQSGLDDDDDDQDAFGLEGAAMRQSRRTTNKSLRSFNDKQVTQLQEELSQLQAKLQEKDEALGKLEVSQKEQATLEQKLADAAEQADSMQSEIERLRQENSSIERDLRSQIDEARQGGGAEEWQQRYSELEKQFEEQQHVTDEVRQSASQSLREMRELSTRSEEAMDREQKMSRRVTQLEQELKDWKTRYARVKTQLRSSRVSSMGLSVKSPETDATFTDPEGMVKDVLVTRFQLSADELINAARGSDNEATLGSMKSLILAVRNISTAVDADSQRHNGHAVDPKHLAKLKSHVSATANNLITATKNHVAAGSLAIVSLLDAAISHLTIAVIALVRLVKIRPSLPGENEEEDHFEDKPAPLSKSYMGTVNGYGHIRDPSRGSGDSTGLSGYSATSSPRQTGGWAARRSEQLATSATAGLRSGGLADFKNYLDDQTAILVHSIQPLVHSIRSKPSNMPLTPDEEDDILKHVNEICSTVQDTCYKTREAIENLNNDALAKHAPPVIEVLEDVRDSLLDAEGQREKIPPLAFKTARAMKELVLRAERIENNELTAGQTIPTDF